MRRSGKHTGFGFSLIELMVVILLMALLASVAAPRLLPMITMTEHQNEARRLVGYGRAAMAHAAMAHKNIVVRIDLDAQEYWTESRPDVYEEPEEAGENWSEEEEDDWIPQDGYELQKASQTILLREDAEQEYANEDDQKKILDRQRENMEKSFASMTRNSMFARARRVQHDEDRLSGDGSIFGLEAEEEVDPNVSTAVNTVHSPFLSPHRVVDSVFIESVHVGDDVYIEGIIDIELSPLGLSTNIAMVLINEDSDIMIVHWDPMTGNAWFVDGGDET
mgnify:CR=1 FL=1